MNISCQTPKPYPQNGLKRPRGDDNAWVFQIVAASDVRWVEGPYWSHPEGGEEVDWGQWSGGQDGQMELSWSAPNHAGMFNINVTGKITCGNGGGGGPIDIVANWFGSVNGKEWDAGLGIGKERQQDGTIIENGQIIKPQDWRVNPPNPPIVLVDPGEVLDLEIETATDYDHWKLGDDEDVDLDDLKYTWEVSGGVLTPSDGRGQTATWKAPNEAGPYLFKCTVDDKPKEIDTNNDEEGNRDDPPLVRQMQVKVASWDIHFDDRNPKACAGHVPDSVHEFTVTATLTREGAVVPNHAIMLYFEGNTNPGKKASFVTGSQSSGDDSTQQIHLTTDANGKVSFTVLSSEAITSSIKIKAKHTVAAIQMPLNGEVTCNFEQAESKRDFNLDPNINSFAGDDDNGWWFNTDVLISGGDQTTAKLYLKYKNKDGDFMPVNGHRMRISIGDITLSDGDGNVSAENYSRYIYFVDSNGNPLKNGEIAVPFVEVNTSTTKQDDPKEQGYATVYLRGGPLIYRATTIKLKAMDLTQVGQ